MVKIKRNILKKQLMTPEKLEQQESLLKIHNSSYSHAKSKNNLSAVGPWIRDNFPLLKIEEKPKEFFIRIDKWTIKRYFVDMENKLRCNDDFFYPSDKAIKELTINPETNSYFARAYKQLLQNGTGSFYVINRKPVLKRKVIEVELEKTSKKPPLKRKRIEEYNKKVGSGKGVDCPNICIDDCASCYSIAKNKSTKRLKLRKSK